MSTHNTKLDAREDLHNAIDELIHNLVAGQAGIEPLLYPNEEDYTMRIEALFEKYYNQYCYDMIVELLDGDGPEPEHTYDNINAHKAWNIKRQLRAEIREKAKRLLNG